MSKDFPPTAPAIPDAPVIPTPAAISAAPEKITPPAAVPPVEPEPSDPAPVAAPQKSGARVWFKDPETGEHKERVMA